MNENQRIHLSHKFVWPKVKSTFISVFIDDGYFDRNSIKGIARLVCLSKLWYCTDAAHTIVIDQQ